MDDFIDLTSVLGARCCRSIWQLRFGCICVANQQSSFMGMRSTLCTARTTSSEVTNFGEKGSKSVVNRQLTPSTGRASQTLQFVVLIKGSICSFTITVMPSTTLSAKAVWYLEVIFHSFIKKNPIYLI